MADQALCRYFLAVPALLPFLLVPTASWFRPLFGSDPFLVPAASSTEPENLEKLKHFAFPKSSQAINRTTALAGASNIGREASIASLSPASPNRSLRLTPAVTYLGSHG